MSSSRLRAYIELLIAVIIWGVGATVIKFALGTLPPFTFLTYRFFLTTLILLPFFLLSKPKIGTPKDFLYLIVIGFLGSTLNLGLYFYGTKLSSSLDASLITSTAPILIVLAGAIFLRERVTKKEKVGIAITILGTLVIALQALIEKGPNTASSILGNVLLMITNIVFAAYLILSKEKLRDKVSPFTLTFATFTVGFVTTLPLTLFEGKFSNLIPTILHLSIPVLLAVLYMAVASGALAYFLYQRAQKTIEASEASVFQYLQPLATAPVAVLWLGEKITLPMVLGSILIAIGVILAEYKQGRKSATK